MQALTFWKTITMDYAGFLDQFISVLEENHVQYCVIGGQGVNAYVDPLVSLDLDLVIAADQLDQVEALLEAGGFQLKGFPHRLNVRHFPVQACACRFKPTPVTRLFRKGPPIARCWG